MIRRRKFITLLVGAAAWSLAARAQQPKIPKVGFLYPGPSTAATARVDAFLGGLRMAGYRVPEQVEFISRFATVIRHGLRHCMRLRGFSGARDEFHLAAIVQNLKTLANHIWRPLLCRNLRPQRVPRTATTSLKDAGKSK
jgi:hypothetical protein